MLNSFVRVNLFSLLIFQFQNATIITCWEACIYTLSILEHKMFKKILRMDQHTLNKLIYFYFYRNEREQHIQAI